MEVKKSEEEECQEKGKNINFKRETKERNSGRERGNERQGKADRKQQREGGRGRVGEKRRKEDFSRVKTGRLVGG